MPDSTRAISVSRRLPGASPTATSAPQRRNTSAAATTTLGCVLICGAAASRLDKVRLQQHLPPANPPLVEPHRAEPGGNGVGQRAVVALIPGEKHGSCGGEEPPQQRVAERRRGHRARPQQQAAPAEFDVARLVGRIWNHTQ